MSYDPIMGGSDEDPFGEDLWAPAPGRPIRSAPLPPIVWFVILLALISFVALAIWATQVNKITNELQKVTNQLQRTPLSTGFVTGTTQSSVFQQIQQALSSGTPTTPHP